MTPIKPAGSLRNLRLHARMAIVGTGLAILVAATDEGGLMGSAAATPICETSGIPILITIDKVRSAKGTIKVELYDGRDKNSAKKRKKVARTRVKAQLGQTRLCLNAPSKGDYAIALYHDENDNKKLDRNFIGIPREGFGFSNNPPIRLGMPAHEEMRFRVDYWAATVRISVVYL